MREIDGNAAIEMKVEGSGGERAKRSAKTFAALGSSRSTNVIIQFPPRNKVFLSCVNVEHVLAFGSLPVNIHPMAGNVAVVSVSFVCVAFGFVVVVVVVALA